MHMLKEYCLHITDGEHSTVSNDEYGKYFLLSNKNLINGKVEFLSNDRKISYKSFLKINKRTKMAMDDVLISTVGTIGKVAFVEGENNYQFQRSVGIIKCDSSVLLPKFLYYYLQSPFIQNTLNNTSKGAVQKCIFIDDLKNLPVSIPSLYIQEKITRILKIIDTQISLNNKINAELEKLAKELYEYWFVQFDFPDENNRPISYRIFAQIETSYQTEVQYA